MIRLWFVCHHTTSCYRLIFMVKKPSVTQMSVPLTEIHRFCKKNTNNPYFQLISYNFCNKKCANLSHISSSSLFWFWEIHVQPCRILSRLDLHIHRAIGSAEYCQTVTYNMTNCKQKIVSLCQFATFVKLIIILYDVQKTVDMKLVVFFKSISFRQGLFRNTCLKYSALKNKFPDFLQTLRKI